MKIESVYIGPLKITTSDFLEWISPRLEKLGLELEYKYAEKEARLLSKAGNIKYMKDGDPRIEKLGRKFLYTHAPTGSQAEAFKTFLSKNNILASFSPDVDSWIKSDKPESELGE